MENKLEFVRNELQALCKKVNTRVINVTYLVASPSNEEYVEITYSNLYRKRICVTADSLRAIVIDVMREIG